MCEYEMNVVLVCLFVCWYVGMIVFLYVVIVGMLYLTDKSEIIK